MKKLIYLSALLGIVAVTGCMSPRGGTMDDSGYTTGSGSSNASESYGFGTSGPTETMSNPTINARGQGAVPPVTPP